MNVGEIKNAVMFQTNNDVDDIADYIPYLIGYIGEGYDKLVYAYAGVHPSAEEETYKPLRSDHDVPATPEWTHRALADWATWMIYRNGNSQKQQRGYAFRSAFEEIIAKVISEGGAKGKAQNFFNIPR